jgi:hypothetical protein
MHAPPDPEMRKAALPGGPEIAGEKLNAEESTETIRDFQAAKLRRIYCFCHATACTIASLAFAGGPR